MARKTSTFTVTKDGSRDFGKMFFLTEMPADKAEKWAARALLAIMKSGIEIPKDVASAGLAGVASIGLTALGQIDWALAEPLLDEMFRCVEIIPDPTRPMVIRGLIPEDIEEVETRLMLRKEVLKLHMDFSIAAKLSTSGSAAQA